MKDPKFLDIISQEIPNKSRVIYTVLDWGLGHATRSIPIIRGLLSQGNEVHLASNGLAFGYLKNAFPSLPIYKLCPYDVTYGKNMVISIVWQLPKILRAFFIEKQQLRALVNKYGFDVVISDHRYGTRGKKTKNIIIAHQINIHAEQKILAKIASRVNHYLINRFDQCWIPDYKGENSIAKQLSAADRLKSYRHLGPLSRFEKKEFPTKYDIAIVISGPEPQRTIFENLLLNTLGNISTRRIILVRGTKKILETNFSQDVIDIADTEQLNEVLCGSKLVICRSGYSSIMDLLYLGKRAVFIPTPGQTEQEYLATTLEDHSLFSVCEQKFIERDLNRKIEQKLTC